MYITCYEVCLSSVACSICYYVCIFDSKFKVNSYILITEVWFHFVQSSPIGIFASWDTLIFP